MIQYSVPTRFVNEKKEVPHFEPIVITGEHSGNGNLLYYLPKAMRPGNKPPIMQQSQFRGMRTKMLVRPMTPEEQVQYRKLYHAKCAADNAFDQFERKVAMDGWEKVREAVAEKVAALADEEAEADDVQSLKLP